jgi:ribosome-binding protein aMBF1 (putative translation factor)
MTDKLPKVPASPAITRMEQAMADLHARLRAERKREHQKAELVGFLKKRPLLNGQDVKAALTALGRGTRKKGEKAVTSGKANLATGRMIEDARKAKGLSAAQLGKAVGRHGSTVAYWERGHGPVPDELRPKIAKVLGISAKVLANGHAPA